MKKILVVDDDRSITELVSQILSLEGFRVETAQGHGEVMFKISRFNPELIILDMLLSNEDGRTICQDLKSNEQFNVIPIVMMSAYPGAHNTIIHCGADAFIAKPFQIDELLHLVHKYVNF